MYRKTLLSTLKHYCLQENIIVCSETLLSAEELSLLKAMVYISNKLEIIWNTLIFIQINE